MLDGLITWIEGIVGSYVKEAGYFGVAFLMMLDSLCVPIPSEAILPVAGMLVKNGMLNFHLAAWSGAIGCFFGNAFAYWIGQYGGRPFIEKYGKYVFIRKKEIQHAEEWFEKYGMPAAFFSRFVPVVRTFISIPMGMYRAKFWPFMILSFCGALIWCYLWTWVGFSFQSYRTELKPVMKVLDYVVLVGIVGFITYWFVIKRRQKYSNG